MGHLTGIKAGPLDTKVCVAPPSVCAYISIFISICLVDTTEAVVNSD